MKNQGIRPADLERIYRNRFHDHSDYRTRVWKTLVNRFFSRLVAPDATVLDLGCGYGEFINNIQCGKKFAMDLNPAAREHVNADVIFLEQDCAYPWDLAEGTLDLVFTSNFFEHIPSKLALSETVAQASRCIRPDGRLIVMGPNIRYVGHAYWDFCDHHLPLTDASIVELLQTQGFQIERAVDRFLPYTMANTRRVPTALIELYLSMPPLWKIFGKQFLIVGKKL